VTLRVEHHRKNAERLRDLTRHELECGSRNFRTRQTLRRDEVRLIVRGQRLQNVRLGGKAERDDRVLYAVGRALDLFHRRLVLLGLDDIGRKQKATDLLAHGGVRNLLGHVKSLAGRREISRKS